MTATLRLTEQLISLPSVTPDDAGCLPVIVERLRPLGFECDVSQSGPDDFRVTNLWARRGSGQRPTLIFAGHTDVVPTGPLTAWTSDPFVPTHREGKLFGRGASDMKASLAAMVVACEEFFAEHPDAPIDVAFLLTSDEEGPANDGTVVVCEALKARGERLDWCIVGEPTSVERTGDMIKNGRRGSMGCKLTVKGIQGHIAYPHLARNPVHMAAPALAELAATEWDKGNEFFPPTTWQISNIHAGTGATNVIPGSLEVIFNFRFCTESTPEGLQGRVADILASHDLHAGEDYDIEWTVSGLPFLTGRGTLVNAVSMAIAEVTGIDTELSTSGGTSDGRFIARICPEVVEFGPPNATIHKIDEHVCLNDIEPLKNAYRQVLVNLSEAVNAAEAEQA
ncbi:succinyl-diaminopimelate desuccinylase [Hydrogenophaga sp. 5NK40-0174]|uniref:succinyl-diaminopimelate desuccinylase n=1 Tax=Hydrogenophaga sp. 5NK40-0174 TaxID=3127649 RepID=UPI00310797EB